MSYDARACRERDSGNGFEKIVTFLIEKKNVIKMSKPAASMQLVAVVKEKEHMLFGSFVQSWRINFGTF